MTEKELAALAANGTKVYVFDEPDFLQRYLEVAPNGNWAVELTLENCKEYVLKHGYKPILFPLSMLTQEITINGKTFVPMRKILNEKTLDSYRFKKMYRFGEYDRLHKIPHDLFQKLLEWKFDCFNLIERGLAISISENFNPYK